MFGRRVRWRIGELGAFAQDVCSEWGTSFPVGRGVQPGCASARWHLVFVFRASPSGPACDARGHDHAHGECAVAPSGCTADTSTSAAPTVAATPTKGGQAEAQAQAGVQAATTKTSARHHCAATPTGPRTGTGTAS